MLFQQSWRSSHICWALVGCVSFTVRSNSSQTISIGLRSGDREGQVVWCNSPSWSNSPYTAWMCVFGHCPSEKQMIVPLSQNQMGWHIATECWVAMLLKCALNVKYQRNTPTPPPPCFSHTCRDNPFTYSTSHQYTAVGTKNLKFGLIRPKDRFPPV